MDLFHAVRFIFINVNYKIEINDTVDLFKDAALTWVIGLNTHLDEAHIDLDRSKFVLFRIYNHVQ